jgi:hypothetical protein
VREGSELLVGWSLIIIEHMIWSVGMRLKEWAAQQGIHYQTAWK